MADGTIDYIAKRIDDVADKVDNVSNQLSAHVAKFEAHEDRHAEGRAVFEKHTDILNSNTASLKEHMRRTDILETYVKGIEERFTPVEQESQRRKHVREAVKNTVFFIAKLGGAGAALTGLVAFVRYVLQHLP